MYKIFGQITSSASQHSGSFQYITSFNVLIFRTPRQIISYFPEPSQQLATSLLESIETVSVTYLLYPDTVSVMNFLYPGTVSVTYFLYPDTVSVTYFLYPDTVSVNNLFQIIILLSDSFLQPAMFETPVGINNPSI